MLLSLTNTQWIKKNKDSRRAFLSLVIPVLFLFIIHLILIPFTFTPSWHCPMMDNMKQVSAPSMNMNGAMPCTHMENSHKKGQMDKQRNHIHHGTFICPLCNGLTLLNPFLAYTAILFGIFIIPVSFKYRLYQGQAPPRFPFKPSFPRAPPIF